MTTKFDIPDICREEICIGSEETVSVKSEEDPSVSFSADEQEDGEMELPSGTPAPRGRADSGALLDMLAEVASQKLLFSPMKRDSRKDHDGKLTPSQVRGLSTNQLIHLFSTTEFDEMRKWYTYFCAFDSECSSKFVSFGSENRAKDKFKEHLFNHLETLKDPLMVSKRRLSAAKRTRRAKSRDSPVKQESAETIEYIQEEEEEAEEDNDQVELQEEEEEVEEEEEEEDLDMKPQLDWDDNFIMSEPKSKVEVEIVGQETVESEENSSPAVSGSAVVDLSGLIAGLTEKMGGSGDHSYSTSQNNVFFYVVEGNSMVVRGGPPVAQQVDVKSEGEYNVIRSSELPVIANKRGSQQTTSSSLLLDPSALWELRNGEHIERDEFHLQRKPKGKAKFIGQSKAEKEQALAAIEAIRMKTGGGLDTLQCNICQPPRSFTAPTTLISHYRSHAGIKPYECRVCCAVFTRQHSLNYHMLIHTNQTRFTCQDCGRKFRHPSHFREHRRRHTGESPFECSDCLLRFKTRNTYKRHLRTRHGKVLTTSGGLIILSEDEFQMVRTAPRANSQSSTNVRRSRHQRKPPTLSNQQLETVDEDMQALHQLEIINPTECEDGYNKDNIDMEDMPADFLEDDSGGAGYEEIVREAVRLERAETQPIHVKEEAPAEETLIIETEDPLTGSGLYLATLEDGETVLVNTREDDSFDSEGRVDLGWCKVGQVRRNSSKEPTVIVIKNES